MISWLISIRPIFFILFAGTLYFSKRKIISIKKLSYHIVKNVQLVFDHTVAQGKIFQNAAFWLMFQNSSHGTSVF